MTQQQMTTVPSPPSDDLYDCIDMVVGPEATPGEVMRGKPEGGTHDLPKH